jgi:Fe2+ or Zn2+ uptake regulation protein
MDTESKESRAEGGIGLERAIVLQLLRDDHERMWSRAQLTTELQADRSKIDLDGVEEALARLERAGVLGVSEQAMWASNAVRRLDELGLIAV